MGSGKVGVFGLVAGLVGVMLHVGLKSFWSHVYSRLVHEAPVVGVQGLEYGRRLLAAVGRSCSVEVEPWRCGGECDHWRRRLLLPPAARADTLDAVLSVAHEVGHAVLDRGLAVRLGSGLGLVAVAVLWIAVVFAAGWLRVPLAALFAVAGSLFLAGDMLMRELRVCRFARDCVCRDFPDPACRAWAWAQTRLEIWHLVQMTVALGLVFLAAGALLYFLGEWWAGHEALA